MKKRLILLTIGLGLVLAVYRVSQTSQLKVSIIGGSASNYNYTILKQANDKSSKIDSTATTVSRLTGAGSYEIRVTQGNLNAFGVVKTRGFFQTTSISLNLHPERARQFVGDNPGVCMGLIGGVLLSGDCSSGALTQPMNRHVPATADTPTYIEPYSAVTGYIEGSATTKLGQVTLFRGQLRDTLTHTAYLNLSPTQTTTASNRVVLNALNTNVNYLLAPYKDGFIAYDTAFDNIYYYASLAATPVKITISGPADKTLLASALSTSSTGDIAIAYVNAPSENTSAVKTRPTSEVVVYNGSLVNHYHVNEHFSGIGFCGIAKLCTLNSASGVLEVRDIAKQLKQLFAIHLVTSIAGQGSSFVAFQDKAMLSFDADTAMGFSAYQYSGYGSCGFQNAENGYLLCLTDSSQKRLGLYLNLSAPNTDSIDKKIAQLKQKTSDVTAISIVGKVIFITPNGELVYDTATHSYLPDPTIQRRTTARIMGDLDAIGIDRTVYAVNITSPN